MAAAQARTNIGSHNTNLGGGVAHGALELYMFLFRRCKFLMTLACLEVSSKQMCYRDIPHIILKHTHKQQAGIKSNSAEERGESYDSYKYVFKFR